MLKVLHCIYDDKRNPWVGGGGAERVFELYRRLRDRVDVTVITGAFPGARDGVVGGVRFERLGAARPYVWSRLSFALQANLRVCRGKHDVVVWDFSTYTPMLMPKARSATVVHHRATHPLLRAVEHLMLRRSPRFSATSQAMMAELACWAPVHLVQSGVAEALWTVARREQAYLLYFGRIDIAHKGLDILLRAFATLPSHLTLRLAGRGRDGKRIAALARALQIEDRVEMLGAVSDERRAELYSGALAVVMPSRFEGFGLVAIEAMASGAPLIVTDLPALREVVADAALLVPPRDLRALADAMQMLAVNASLRRELSRRGRDIASRFRWERAAEDHYRFLLQAAAT